MKYLFLNMTKSNLLLDLLDPDPIENNKKLNRPGSKIAVTLPKGTATDILKYFDGSVEKAHASVKFSKDVLKATRTGDLVILTTDDKGEELDLDALFGKKAPEAKKDSEAEEKARLKAEAEAKATEEAARAAEEEARKQAEEEAARAAEEEAEEEDEEEDEESYEDDEEDVEEEEDEESYEDDE